MATALPDHLDPIRSRIAKAPTGPGVYRWLSEDGDILYVGKAKNLRARLRSYVAPASWPTLGPWKQALMRQARDFAMTVTESELAALLLETNLIKEHRPKYNILMKDDKNFIYVRVTTRDPYPRIDTVRKMENDGATYFGPKTSAGEVRQMLADLRRVFPFRTCRMDIEPQSGGATSLPLDVVCRNKDRATPCLDHHIGQCPAPCIGAITTEEYRQDIIEPVLRLLKGDNAPALAVLQEKMRKAAADRKFELAAQMRDQCQRIERMEGKTIVSDVSREDADIIGVAVLAGRAHVVVLRRRDGRIVEENAFGLQGHAEDATEALTHFLPQYYSVTDDIPPLVVLGAPPEDGAILRAWMCERAGRVVELRVPERGDKSKLLELANRNAEEKARQLEAKWESEARNAEQALAQLQETLLLPAAPKRIEGYDISHLGGTETVGSMVVMIAGKAASDQYRTFAVHTLRRGDIDDFASLAEVVGRRLRHLTGGLKGDEVRWKERGIVCGKARKADEAAITAFIRSHPEDLSDDNIRAKDFLLARTADGSLAACCRLFALPDNGPTLLRSVLVAPEWRGNKLGHFVSRKILAGVKKGKVYVTIDPALEQYYATIGFRHVLKNPPALDAWLASFDAKKDTLVMVYDATQHKADRSLQTPPDLLVIDGGKGQLSAVEKVLRQSGLTIPVIGLAKREEEIFVPGQSAPVQLAKDAPGQFLLQRLRDEAHRFANKLREQRGFKAATASALDAVAGIGPETRKALLRHFGSVESIRSASDADLRAILSEAQLQALRGTLQ